MCIVRACACVHASEHAGVCVISVLMVLFVFPQAKPKKKAVAASGSDDSDGSTGYVPLAKRAAGRARKVTSYKVDLSSDEE